MLAAVLLAKWTWILFAPTAMSVAPANSEISPEVAGHLLGIASEGASDGATSAVPYVHLLGVFSGDRGCAIFEMADKKQRGVALGAEVEKGVKLISTAPDYVVLSNGAVQQRVPLENKVGNGKSPAPPVGLPVSQLQAVAVNQMPAAQQGQRESGEH